MIANHQASSSTPWTNSAGMKELPTCSMGESSLVDWFPSPPKKYTLSHRHTTRTYEEPCRGITPMIPMHIPIAQLGTITAMLKGHWLFQSTWCKCTFGALSERTYINHALHAQASSMSKLHRSLSDRCSGSCCEKAGHCKHGSQKLVNIGKAWKSDILFIGNISSGYFI